MTFLKNLISRLNPICYRSLESATSLCARRGHFHVEIEHWFLALSEIEESEFIRLLKSHCDLNQLKDDLNHSLMMLKSGNDRSPMISDRIIQLIHEAWLIASLEHQRAELSSGFLLAAMLSQRELNQLLISFSPVFSTLSSEEIKKRLKEGDHEDKASIKQKNMTLMLNQFAVNLNKLAKQGKIDAAIGREKEVTQMVDILSRRRQNNVILAGDPGVGKTAIVEGLARRIVSGQVPDRLRAVEIFALDLGLLQAGAGIKGEFENRLKTLIQEIQQYSNPIILFIDEAHLLIGAGAQQGQADAANLLKPALARGELRCIAATTWREYKQYFEKDAALARRFQLIKVVEPSVKLTIQMLRSLVPSLEAHHRIKISDEAITAAAILSDRYLTYRKLPDKAISVLDSACARVSSQHSEKPHELESIDQQLELNQQEILQLNKELKRGEQHQARLDRITREDGQLRERKEKLGAAWEASQRIATRIIELSTKLDDAQSQDENELRKLYKIYRAKSKESQLVHPFVNSDVVASIIAEWTGIPLDQMCEDERQRLIKLEDRLRKYIVGQDHALASVVSSIQVSQAKLANPDKPIAVFLFVGPSGVGKTETALALAETIYQNRDSITILNMSEFQEAHKVALLAGSPPGYVGYGEGGILTEAVKRNPYSVILLDEIEKAHSAVNEFFYQVFDKGILRDGEGELVSFKNSLIILTSNLCGELVTGLRDRCLSEEQMQVKLSQALSTYLKPAFLGRVKIIPYFGLNDDHRTEILNHQLGKIADRVKREYQITIHFDRDFKDELLSKATNASIGARAIEQSLDQELLPKLSRYLLSTKKHKKVLHISKGNFDL